MAATKRTGTKRTATKPTGKKAPKKAITKKAAKTKSKIVGRTRASSQTRSASSRELQNLQRLDPLIKSYQTAGLSPQAARQRAIRELGVTPPKGWSAED
jgi:hypothetical protein